MDYIIAGIATVVLFAYLVYALLRPESSEATMTATRHVIRSCSSSSSILALTKPLGVFMARVFEGERTFLHPVLRPARAADLPAVAASAKTSSSAGRQYAARCSRSASRSSCSPICIHAAPGLLPLNPLGFSTEHAAQDATPMTPDLAFNTAVSFMTNTNWQAYSARRR